jgi:phenylacetate-CoA ligase
VPTDDVRLSRLDTLLALAGEHAPFHRSRLGHRRVAAWDELGELPLTTRDELLADQLAHPPFGTNLTQDVARGTHAHRTAGTTGEPLRVLSTAEDWAWWRDGMAATFAAAGIGLDDRVAIAHPFTLELAAWAALAGAEAVGALIVPVGAGDAVERLAAIREHGATVLLCRPSHAVHLAAVAQEHDLEDATASVGLVLCTGEPGASVPALRERIESAWGARCLEYAAPAEVGPVARPCEAGGMHLDDEGFACELLEVGGVEPAAAGQPAELVVTALGRTGFPVIRYRTGDVVQPHDARCPHGHPGRWLPSGILGRVQDMAVIRGRSVFPSSIEQILRESSGVGAFRITFDPDAGGRDDLKVEAELAEPGESARLRELIAERLGLRSRIVPLRAGTLPRRGSESPRARAS